MQRSGSTTRRRLSIALPGLLWARSGREAGKLSLSLEGYNYTNRYIDSFSVDRQGASVYLNRCPRCSGNRRPIL